MAIDCAKVEEFYLEYAVEGLLSRKDLFKYLFFLKQSPTWPVVACEYLNAVIDEICESDILSPYDHNPHFPYFVTHYTDSMPMCTVALFRMCCLTHNMHLMCLKSLWLWITLGTLCGFVIFCQVPWQM